ncbi:hypothetical protein [Alysiella crassa]|uniref:hypothetical protein n=1 Tax=Alysiella crassa TaxID=153491 RepID=UPI001FD21143|nr:hypothetical protein [Alysiella crassa]UOP06980.1 hypothetical protein LVJ80_00320 [Alysiella crassa]
MCDKTHVGYVLRTKIPNCLNDLVRGTHPTFWVGKNCRVQNGCLKFNHISA